MLVLEFPYYFKGGQKIVRMVVPDCREELFELILVLEAAKRHFRIKRLGSHEPLTHKQLDIAWSAYLWVSINPFPG